MPREPLLASVVVSGLPVLVALGTLNTSPLVFTGDPGREHPALFFGPRRSLVAMREDLFGREDIAA